VALVQVAEQMAAGSASFYDATIELAQVLYRISLAQIVPDALPEDWQLSKMVRELAPHMGADEVQLYYSIVTQAREQLHLAPDPDAAGV
jgi:DNA polymerase-3 subunit gamma/tau